MTQQYAYQLERNTMKIFRLLGLSLAFLIMTAQWSLAAKTWQLDDAHSVVSFRVNHILAQVLGTFADYDVKLTMDPAHLEQTTLYIEIKTGSINTLIPKRDKHLNSADFFDSSRFPTMTFQSTSVQDMGDGLLNVQGKFTVKEQVYDLTIPVQYLGLADHPMAKGSKVLGLSIETSLDRLAYGIGNGGFVQRGVVGQDVEVFISLEMLGK